jgi:hypothetical protein
MRQKWPPGDDLSHLFSCALGLLSFAFKSPGKRGRECRSVIRDRLRPVRSRMSERRGWDRSTVIDRKFLERSERSGGILVRDHCCPVWEAPFGKPELHHSLSVAVLQAWLGTKGGQDPIVIAGQLSEFECPIGAGHPALRAPTAAISSKRVLTARKRVKSSSLEIIRSPRRTEIEDVVMIRMHPQGSD